MDNTYRSMMQLCSIFIYCSNQFIRITIYLTSGIIHFSCALFPYKTIAQMINNTNGIFIENHKIRIRKFSTSRMSSSYILYTIKSERLVSFPSIDKFRRELIKRCSASMMNNTETDIIIIQGESPDIFYC